MKRRYHPPANPEDSRRLGEYYPKQEPFDVDAFFKCRHGVDKSEHRCEACDLELAERLKEMQK